MRHITEEYHDISEFKDKGYFKEKITYFSVNNYLNKGYYNEPYEEMLNNHIPKELCSIQEVNERYKSLNDIRRILGKPIEYDMRDLDEIYGVIFKTKSLKAIIYIGTASIVLLTVLGVFFCTIMMTNVTLIMLSTFSFLIYMVMILCYLKRIDLFTHVKKHRTVMDDDY